MMVKKRLKSLIRNNSGATVIEFAMVTVPMMGMILSSLDLAHGYYVNSLIQGAVDKGGRDSSLQNKAGYASQADYDAAIDAIVKAAVLPAVPFATGTCAPASGQTAAVTSNCMSFARKSFYTFANISRSEQFTDTNHNGVRNTGECYVDDDADRQWDAATGNTGQGGANSIVVYTVTINYDHIFPVASFFGAPKSRQTIAQTILRNQPYATSSAPSVICT